MKLKANYSFERPFWYGPIKWWAGYGDDSISMTDMYGKFHFLKVIGTGSSKQLSHAPFIFSNQSPKKFSGLNEAKLWFEIANEDVCWSSLKEDADVSIYNFALKHNRDAFEI